MLDILVADFSWEFEFTVEQSASFTETVKDAAPKGYDATFLCSFGASSEVVPLCLKCFLR